MAYKNSQTTVEPSRRSEASPREHTRDAKVLGVLQFAPRCMRSTNALEHLFKELKR